MLEIYSWSRGYKVREIGRTEIASCCIRFFCRTNGDG